MYSSEMQRNQIYLVAKTEGNKFPPIMHYKRDKNRFASNAAFCSAFLDLNAEKSILVCYEYDNLRDSLDTIHDQTIKRIMSKKPD